MSKAIDRAALWTAWLEEVGFEIECETDTDIFGSEYLTVRANKGKSKVMFVIQMDTKFTRFIHGATGYCRLGAFTRKPSVMSSRVSSQYMLEHAKTIQREVTA